MHVFSVCAIVCVSRSLCMCVRTPACFTNVSVTTPQGHNVVDGFPRAAEAGLFRWSPCDGGKRRWGAFGCLESGRKPHISERGDLDPISRCAPWTEGGKKPGCTLFTLGGLMPQFYGQKCHRTREASQTDKEAVSVLGQPNPNRRSSEVIPQLPKPLRPKSSS